MVLKVDLLIGGVLAVALLGSIVGVAVYEETVIRYPFEAEWSLEGERLPLQRKTQVGPGTVSIPVTLGATNMSVVSFNFVIIGETRPRPQPVDVKVEIIPPASTNLSSKTKDMTLGSPSGTVQPADLDFLVAMLPTNQTIQATGLKDARAQAQRLNVSDAGQGEWRVDFTFATVALPGNTGGETFEVTVNPGYSHWSVKVAAPKLPDTGGR